MVHIAVQAEGLQFAGLRHPFDSVVGDELNDQGQDGNAGIY